jgi:crotonobetainyl-CoA:carnitine CoA-transferase CaiB-like acyl-CoA transferase
MDVVAIAQANDVLCGAVNTMDEVVNSPQFAARGWVTEIDHPVAGTLRYPGGPAQSEGWWQIRRAAPLLGQHTADVLGELGRTPADLARLRESGVI